MERKDCSEEWAHREIYFGINVNKKLHNNLTPSTATAALDMPCSFCYYANMACKPIFAFHAIYHFAFLYRTLDFTHNLKKNPSEVIESNILSLDNRTIINVCHKFNQNNLNKYDKIYVIEGGRLVVEGNYSEIHNNKIFKKYKNNDLNFETEKVME